MKTVPSPTSERTRRRRRARAQSRGRCRAPFPGRAGTTPPHPCLASTGRRGARAGPRESPAPHCGRAAPATDRRRRERDGDGRVVAVLQRIADQVVDELRDAIAVPGPEQRLRRRVHPDLTTGIPVAQADGGALDHRLRVHRARPGGDPLAEARIGEIDQLRDQGVDPRGAAVDPVDGRRLPRLQILSLLQQHLRRDQQRGERVAQVVPDDRIGRSWYSDTRALSSTCSLRRRRSPHHPGSDERQDQEERGPANRRRRRPSLGAGEASEALREQRGFLSGHLRHQHPDLLHQRSGLAAGHVRDRRRVAGAPQLDRAAKRGRLVVEQSPQGLDALLLARVVAGERGERVDFAGQRGGRGGERLQVLLAAGEEICPLRALGVRGQRQTRSSESLTSCVCSTHAEDSRRAVRDRGEAIRHRRDRQHRGDERTGETHRGVRHPRGHASVAARQSARVGTIARRMKPFPSAPNEVPGTTRMLRAARRPA